MRPSRSARTAAAITLSKGKMFEYGVPVEHHLALPADLDLELQFPLAIGTLGDFAAETLAVASGKADEIHTRQEDVRFAAQVLVAVEASRQTPQLSGMLRLLAAAAFYLSDVPGTAAALLLGVELAVPEADEFAYALRHLLRRPWQEPDRPLFVPRLRAVLDAVASHFLVGEKSESLLSSVRRLRRSVYANGSPHELLLADLVGAVALSRFERSGWSLLPQFSGLSIAEWRPYLGRAGAVKEIWPAQRLLGEAGLFRGESSVVQMPTSAGKTRAVELILRSAFTAKRTALGVVVAPFRALCQEIANDLSAAFDADGWVVNRLSDAIQQDYKGELSAFLQVDENATPHVVVLTPEKLLYVLRQEPKFVEKIGLVVYDEGHQFDSGTRGVTYELLLTSIKRELPSVAQSVLISAVIKNSREVAAWLLGDGEKVVSDKWLQTRRLVAFASLPAGRLGQLQFLPAVEGEQEFFVPRVIVPERLESSKREKERFFPNSDSGSLALYLGLRLAENGGVAVYVRMPASAAKLVRDAATQVFPRKPSVSAPAIHCNGAELTRLVYLYSRTFGEDSYLTRAAALGIFAHHGETPYGIRLAVEHAMRELHIRFIVCTSTLAQGVNLPIRYLLVTTPMQGRDAIKARDFHNLIGRAGRAGMYGEGTVLFSDPTLFDERSANPRRWRAAQALLSPNSAEDTGSTLLQLFKELSNDPRTRVLTSPNPNEIVRGLVDEPEDVYAGLQSLDERLLQRGFTVEGLKRQLDGKKNTIEAIESFLMAYRENAGADDFSEFARELAAETLAYAIGTDEEKGLLQATFERIAHKISDKVPQPDDQVRYGRTLFGVDKSLKIDGWVKANLWELELCTNASELFETVWPFLLSITSDPGLQRLEPSGCALKLAQGWMAGTPLFELHSSLSKLGAYIPQKSRKRKLDVDAIVGLCEQTLGYEFGLYLAALKAAFASQVGEGRSDEVLEYFDFLQKQLKYGLPSQDAVSYYEAGFSERVVAQDVASAVVLENADSPRDARRLVRKFSDDIEEVVRKFPAYFYEVFNGLRSEPGTVVGS